MSKLNDKILQFRSLYNNGDFENVLKIVTKDMRDCYVTQFLKLLGDRYKNEIDDLKQVF